MKKFLGCLLLALFFVLSLPMVVRAEATPVTSDVRFHEGRLSVIFVNVPIRDALEQVATRTGLTVFFDPEIQGTLSSRFQNLPLETALQRLLRTVSHAFVFPNNPESGQGVGSVRVFRRGRQSSARYERLGGAGVARPGRGKATATTATTGKPGGGQDGTGTARGVAEGGTPSVSSRSSIASINPHSVSAPALLMRAIVETQREMAYLQRKAAGEERALRREMAQAQRELASGGGDPSIDPRQALERLRTLEEQMARLKQGNVLRLMEEQKKMQLLTEKMAQLGSPADQVRSEAARREQQARVRRHEAAVRARSERRAQAKERAGR